MTPPRVLRAGALSAEFEAGNLRYIRFGGVEMVRAVSYIVRDKNWGTYNPAISDLKSEENADGFRVDYSAVAGDDAQEFAYRAEIVGRPDGTLRFAARGRPVTDFLTNRTGFVVLHPIENVSGKPARVTEATGKTFDTTFPELIDPVQPMMNLRAIAHEFVPGMTVECRMEGDTFEMEDQRNWTDASYKTYVRPLALPWPYTLTNGIDPRAIGDADRLRRGAAARAGVERSDPPAHRRSRGRGPCPRARLRSRRRGGRARARLGPACGGRLASRLPL